ncbi:hypothetical protein RCH09_001704 [Actimicrobium sp. GrIS 1.19]|nr:hypothetical protein [Actimicrobium sp. GrIS 1.19]
MTVQAGLESLCIAHEMIFEQVSAAEMESMSETPGVEQSPF